MYPYLSMKNYITDRMQKAHSFRCGMDSTVYVLHNLEVDRLTGKNNLSSIAIWKREYINRFWHEPYAIANGYNGIFGSESFIEVH